MANRPSVHVEQWESGWAVVREGREQATSVHRTQAEAAKEGRDIARRDKTEFFLHAQDGRIREHNNYGEEPRPAQEEGAAAPPEGLIGAVTETVGEVTEGASAAIGALGATASEAAEKPGRKEERPGRATTRGAGTAGEGPEDGEEARDLADEQRGDDRTDMPEETYADYELYDQQGERIGKLDDVFVDEADNLEYAGTASSDTGLVLIPAEVLTVDAGSRRMVVSRPRAVVEAGPTYRAAGEVTPEFEERVRGYYGLASGRGVGVQGGYGTYYGSGEVREREEDELRVRRIEEELEVGTRERAAGAVQVRKRVRTDRERVVVPKKRVEVKVERAPVEEEGAPAGKEVSAPEIGEDEIVVPVIEEEVVVEKRPVIKEEIRIRKEVIEDTEVVEEDVRREEVEVDDRTTPGDS